MANIRVDALTEVTAIADDDVVMVDGKQGVRATTWASLKKMIKSQCGIDELNTKNNPEFLNIGNVTPPAVNAGYTYASIPNMIAYKRLTVRAWVGDVINFQTTLYPQVENKREYIISGYASPNYNGRIGVLFEPENNRIGVRAIALTGYEPSACGIGTFVAEK